MKELDLEYPQYNFLQHKGYPTSSHRAALAQYGPCPMHRLTFAPLKGKFDDYLPHLGGSRNRNELKPKK